MTIDYEVKLDFDDVLLRPKRSTLKSRKDVNLNRTFKFKHSGAIWTGIPIIASNMDTTGTFEMGYVLNKFNMMTAIHKFYTLEQWKENTHIFFQNNMTVSIGTREEDFDFLMKVTAIIPDLKFVTIDVANGYGEYFADFISKVRDRFPELTIIAGNVVTYEMTEQLILSGADVVKIGIGPGSACTTRLKTGVGYPQLSAIMECADAAHGLGGRVIADGGCRTPGDVTKAFGAGADFVMLGGMLAGHDESAGELVEDWVLNGYKWENGLVVKDFTRKFSKVFYGMSSDTAQNKYYGGQKEYRASEGRTVKVPYRGSVKATIQEILGGIRSACTYIGASELRELSKCATFIRVNNTHNKIFVNSEI